MTTSSRTRARILAGVVVGSALAVAVPLAASAHVHVTPEHAAAGASSTLTFSFSHGCEESPTTALVVEIPENVTNVVPVYAAGWTIDREVASNGTVTSVTFTADAPIENGIKGEVSLDARFAEELADSAVPFPVTQECVEGSTAWTEVAAEGGAEPELPAPVVAVGAVATADEHGSTEAEHGSSEAGHESTTAGETADAAAEPASDTTALWLSGAGLGLGVIALVVAIAAFARRRA